MPPADKLQALKTRFAGPLLRSKAKPQPRPAKTGGKRVQKNLTIHEDDAKRLAAMAKRDKISQARLLSLALDVYEDCYGPLNTKGRK
ncbi:MAG: hypothetical protein AAFW82_10925 [Pseudomonadota bacterium]